MRKSKYDQLVDAVRGELKRLDPLNQTSVEDAEKNDEFLGNMFGMGPSEAGSYDHCPNHPTRVRFKGQCPDCE